MTDKNKQAGADKFQAQSPKPANTISNSTKKPSVKDSGQSKKPSKSFLFKKAKLKKDAVTALEKELAQMKHSYQYLQAEFANHKRITIKEKQNLMKYGSRLFIQDFLVCVFNDFNQAVQKDWSEKDFENFKKGFIMLCSQTLKTLKNHGVEEINPLGEVFDPLLHEVLSTQVNPSKPVNTVLYVCRKGYKLHDQLIQPAQVIVNKAEEEKETP